MNDAELSWGARQLGWMSCVTTVGRVGHTWQVG